MSPGGRRVLFVALIAVGGLAGACYPNPDDLRNTGGTAGTGGGSCQAPGDTCTLDNQCCQSGSGVSDGAFCIEQTGLCHAKCASNAECVSNCCVAVTGQALGACMSPSFCGLAGVGDPCTSGSQCASGSCDGWCLASCSATDAICESAPGELMNANGFYNWCFATSGGGAACFPGCTTNSDCTIYGAGYTCQSAADVNGFTTRVCST